MKHLEGRDVRQDNFKTFLCEIECGKVKWIELAQDMIRLWALVIRVLVLKTGQVGRSVSYLTYP
jgi:hypothetical protein